MTTARNLERFQPCLDVDRLVREMVRERRWRAAPKRRLGNGTAMVVATRITIANPDAPVGERTGTLHTRLEQAPGWTTYKLRESVAQGRTYWSVECPRELDSQACRRWVKLLYWPLKWGGQGQGQQALGGHCVRCSTLYWGSDHRDPLVTDLCADIRMYQAGIGDVDGVLACLMAGGRQAICARQAMEITGVAERLLTSPDGRKGQRP